MKKLLLASAIAALSVSAANAAPTVYGKVFMTADYIDAELDYDNNYLQAENAARIAYNQANPNADQEELLSDSDGDSLQLNSNSSRIGFKGAEAITANTDVTYKLEYGIDVDGDKKETFKRRDTFLGLKNNSFGEFRFGHQHGPLDAIDTVTLTEGYWDNLGGNNNEATLADALTMLDSSRIDNSILWISPKFEGLPLQFTAMYAADEVFETDGVDRDNGYGASIMFDQGTGFAAGIAYDKDINVAGDVIRGTLSYDASNMTSLPLTVGGMYQETDYDSSNKDEKGFVISAEMGLTNFSKPASIYAQYNNVSDLAGVSGLDSDQFVVGGKYNYKKNVIAHAYAGYNNTEHDNVVEADVFAIGGGLEYKF